MVPLVSEMVQRPNPQPTSTENAYALELIDCYWERLSLPMADMQELIRIAEKALRHLAH